VLRAYADWRARDIRVISAFTDGLARIFASSFAPLRLVRDIGLTAVNILPPVKRGLVRMTSGLTGRLPRLARGLPL
jgi:2-octaprenyl-6-methoxyphenol hydroxylase